MPGIGILLIWAGYSLGYYGLNTVRGGNEAFLALVWPGRFQAVPRDAPGAGGTSSPPGSNTPGFTGTKIGGHPGVGPGAGVPKDSKGNCHLLGLSFLPTIPCPPGS